MAKLPDTINTVATKVFAYWKARGDSEPSRGYLGASIIGAACERSLWYGFRQAAPKQFDGRIYRLFNRGHREEATIVEELRGIGCEVHDVGPDGKQWEIVDCAGHFMGHMDGAAVNTPYAAKTWCVVEFKTHSAKSFKDVSANGVVKSKPMHAAQMQVYMGKTGMTRAMYYAINKDNDDIYAEWLHFDRDEYDRLMGRAHRVITAAEPPMRISNDASWFECRYCDYKSICHGSDMPVVNCGTCAHSTPEMDGDGRWSCAAGGEMATCDKHRFIPALLAHWADMIDTDGTDVTYRRRDDGVVFVNTP